MANISSASIVICFALMLFTIVEVVSLIRSMNRKKGKKVFIHLLGVVATASISFCVIQIAFGVQLSSSTIVTVTAAISVIFFILCSFDSLFETKIDKTKL